MLFVPFKRYGDLFKNEILISEKEYFGGSADYFNTHHKNLTLTKINKKHYSINDDYNVNVIRGMHPDIILVFGTILLSNRIISSAKYVLNLHTGISPYYRGGPTNLWPFIKKEFGYFGVTIHLLSLGIDKGPIIYTVRPKIIPNDNYGTINSRSIILGVKSLIKAIKIIEKGTHLELIKNNGFYAEMHKKQTTKNL